MYIYHIYGTHMIARVRIFYVGYARCPVDVIARICIFDIDDVWCHVYVCIYIIYMVHI
jgi:hypothetical protein